MMKYMCTAISIFALAACGGSGSGSGSGANQTPTAPPLASSGYATTGDVISAGLSFAATNTPRIVNGSNETLILEKQDIVFTINDDASAINLTIDGETYTLVFQGNGFWQLAEGQDSVNYNRILSAGQYAEIVNVFSIQDNELNDSLLVFGFDTDPATVAALSGSGTYNGEILFTARNGIDSGIGDGTITLTANFGARPTIGGSFTSQSLRADSDAVTIPDATFRLNTSAITGNTFGGSVTLTNGTIDGTLTTPSYNGTFFGPNGEIVGGGISATVDVPGLATDTVVTGAFLAE